MAAQNRLNFSPGGKITIVLDSGYTLEGRVRGLELRSEDEHTNVDTYAPSIYATSQRLYFEGEFDGAYTVTQNFVEVLKTLVIKGNHLNTGAATLEKAGVPWDARAKKWTWEDERGTHTTFEWTERVVLDDTK